MSEDPKKADAAAAPGEGAKAAAGGKMAGMIPLIAAAVISVGGSFGAGFYLNKQLLTGINGELQKALTEVQSHSGDSKDAAHGDAKGKAAAGHDDHAAPAAKKDDSHGAAAHAAPAKEEKKADAHGGGGGHGGGHGEPAKPKESPEALAKAAQAKAGLFPLGDEAIVANPSGDTRFVVVKVTIVSVGQADIAEPISTHIDRLRDAVTGFLADQTMETIQKRGFRSQMGAQLALAFNRILGPGTVREVIFPQFVIQ